MDSKNIISTSVKKTFGAEKNKLVVKPMGIVVSRFLYQHFEPLFNFSYTRETEALLDSIHTGTANWVEVCSNQKQYLSTLIKEAKARNIQKFQIPIDSTHCYTIAKYGPVIKQTTPPQNGVGDPEVKWLTVCKDIDLIRLENGGYTLQELVQVKAEPGDPGFLNDHTPGGLPLYGGHYFGVYEDKEIIIRKGKFGRYIVWGDENRSIKCFGSRDVSNIRMEEIVAILSKPKRSVASRSPSSAPPKKSTPTIEQIPTTTQKIPKPAKAPKAPKETVESPSKEDTPKKRGRPKKTENNNINK
jgi:DNA topoisomerase-1